jgi:hypothetical protein
MLFERRFRYTKTLYVMMPGCAFGPNLPLYIDGTAKMLNAGAQCLGRFIKSASHQSPSLFGALVHLAGDHFAPESFF